MKKSGSLAVAALAAALSLVSAPVIAGPNAPLGSFNHYTSLGNILKEGNFEPSAGVQIVGGTIIVLGFVEDAATGTYVPTFKVIEYSGDGTGTGKTVNLGTGFGPRDPIGIDGNVSILVEGVSPKQDCMAPDEPILYTGEESQYQIKWCRKYNETPKWAKKNYYYQFSSGGSPQHVATVKYRCEEDGSLMPPGVWAGSCQ